jgi:hypothetical protein
MFKEEDYQQAVGQKEEIKMKANWKEAINHYSEIKEISIYKKKKIFF